MAGSHTRRHAATSHLMFVRPWLRLMLPLSACLAYACDAAHAPHVTGSRLNWSADSEDSGSPPATIDGGTPLAYYQSVCGYCHGDYRQGVVGPALVPSRLTQDRSVYAKTIRVDHRHMYLPDNAHVLTDAELSLLLDLLLSPPPPPSAARWGDSEIERSLRVMVPDAELVRAPMHQASLDHLVLVVEHDAPTVAVIDGDRHSVLAHVSANARAHANVFHPRDQRWAYNLGQDAWVTKLDLYALRPTRSVRAGIDARAIAISDDGKHLIIGNHFPNSAVVLDAQTLTLEKRIVTSGVDPDGQQVDSRVGVVAAVASDHCGPYFVIVLKEAGQLWRIDYSQPDFPVRELRNVGHNLSDGFLSADTHRFYVDSDEALVVIDVPSWKLVDKLPSLRQPHPGLGARWREGDTEYAASMRDGKAGVNVWELSTGKIVGRVNTQGPGMFLRSHPDSPYVWVDAFTADEPHVLSIFDRRSPSFEVAARIRDGMRTLYPEFTTNGAFVYVSDWDGGVVRVYDARYDAARRTFPLVQTITDLYTPTVITTR